VGEDTQNRLGNPKREYAHNSHSIERSQKQRVAKSLMIFKIKTPTNQNQKSIQIGDDTSYEKKDT